MSTHFLFHRGTGFAVHTTVAVTSRTICFIAAHTPRAPPNLDALDELDVQDTQLPAPAFTIFVKPTLPHNPNLDALDGLDVQDIHLPTPASQPHNPNLDALDELDGQDTQFLLEALQQSNSSS